MRQRLADFAEQVRIRDETAEVEVERGEASVLEPKLSETNRTDAVQGLTELIDRHACVKSRTRNADGP
jgi:hypothetical protein